MAQQKVVIGITHQEHFGGAQRYVYDLATSLPPDLYDTCVIVGQEGTLTHKLVSASVRTVNIPNLKRKVTLWGDIQTAVYLWKFLHREHPDVLHLNSSKMGLIGSIIGRLCGVPRIVFTVHGWAFHAPVSALKRALLYVFSMLIVLFSHRTICVSQYVANAIPKQLRKKAIIIHNGLPNPVFIPREEARAKLSTYGIREDRLWFGTVAELHPVKDHATAIRAFAHIAETTPNFEYLIIGEGTERKNLEQLVKQEKLEGRVHFTGFVSDVSTLLQGLDVFVLPSLSEGLSYALLEAGAAGLPIVTTNTGGMPEVIQNNETGLLVPAHNAEALSEALRIVGNDEALRTKLGTAAREHITNAFSLEAMVAATRATYTH